MSDMATELKPRKITVAEYRRMGEVGILRKGERIELLDGTIVEMSPIGDEHTLLHERIVRYLVTRLQGRAPVFGMASVALGDLHEPQPDILLADARCTAAYRRPTLEDVFALIEIARSSLFFDLGRKRDLYATFGVKDYLVVDVDGRSVHRFSAPAEGRFTQAARLSYGDVFALTRVADIQLEAAAFLPPQDRENF